MDFQFLFPQLLPTLAYGAAVSTRPDREGFTPHLSQELQSEPLGPAVSAPQALKQHFLPPFQEMPHSPPGRPHIKPQQLWFACLFPAPRDFTETRAENLPQKRSRGTLPHPVEQQPRKDHFFLEDQLHHPHQLHRSLIRTGCRFRGWRTKLLFSLNGQGAAQVQGLTGTKAQVTSWSYLECPSE